MARLNNIHIITILSLLGFVIYSNTFYASFHYDDYRNIVFNKNIFMDRFSWDRFLKSSYPDDPYYRPFAYMSFALNYYLCRLSVFGYHLVNIVIHLFAGIGVYLLVKVIGNFPNTDEGTVENRLIAATTAVLWIASPVQTQAVTYIVQRMASMAALFYIYSFLWYVKGRIAKGLKGKAYLSLSILFFFMALGTKENSFTLPILIAFFEFFFIQKNIPRYFNRGTFYISLLATSILVSVAVYNNIAYLHLDTFMGLGYSMKERVFTEGRVIFYYISLMLHPVPAKMALVHDFSPSISLLTPFSTLPSLCLLGGSTIAVLIVKKNPFIKFFYIWFFLNVLPESFFVGLDLAYEHRLYLPSVGFYAITAFILIKAYKVAAGRWKGASITFIALIPIFFSVNTYARNMDWYDELSLWSDNVQKAPFIPKPHEALGMAYIEAGEIDMAEREFEMAKSLDPLSSPASLGLAFVHFKRGESDRAFSELGYIVERRKMGFGLRYEEVNVVFYDMGEELLKAGRREDAINVFRMGLQINPENSEIKEALMRLERGEKWN